MFAFMGLLTLLLVLAGLTCCFESSKPERVLAAMLSAPMLAFGNVEFSKGWSLGCGFAAMAAAVLWAGGLPLLFSIFVLWVASVAFWNDFQSEEVPAVVVVEEYLDDADLVRLIELGERGLALQAEDERETAQKRIHELEADNLQLVALLARAYKPKPEELLDANEDLQEILASFPVHPADLPHPQFREPACA